MKRCVGAGLACLLGLVAAGDARGKIVFDIDYSLDAATNNFFNSGTPNGQAARAALTKAAQVYEDRMLDTLTAITPGGTNTWSTNFTNPGNGTAAVITDLTIPANTIKVYVGARSLSGQLAVGGPGGFGGSGDQAFVDALLYRGQAGAQGSSPTDFGRWGGSIAFSNSATFNFSLTGPVAGQNDFLTVATHELAHVLGFGLAPSWNSRLTQSGTLPSGALRYIGPFRGPKSVALYGANVPLETTNSSTSASHFNNGLSSTVNGVTQETLMDPDIAVGTRKRVTLLDWAALDDIGWDLARPGDADADGVVGFSDLVALAQNYDNNDGQQRWSAGDFNYDGNVDFSDLVLLAQNYDLTGPQPGAELAGTGDFATDWSVAQALAAPEPGAIAILVLPVLWGTGRRRRSNGRL